MQARNAGFFKEATRLDDSHRNLSSTERSGFTAAHKVRSTCRCRDANKGRSCRHTRIDSATKATSTSGQGRGSKGEGNSAACRMWSCLPRPGGSTKSSPREDSEENRWPPLLRNHVNDPLQRGHAAGEHPTGGHGPEQKP